MCIVQTERETLEEKPFILPTDSPVSAPSLCIVIGFLDRFPVTEHNNKGDSETNHWTSLFTFYVKVVFIYTF